MLLLTLFLLFINSYTVSPTDLITNSVPKFVVLPSLLYPSDLTLVRGRKFKPAIIKQTTPEYKIVFVGNSTAYVYYTFYPKDDRDSALIPFSGNYADDFKNEANNSHAEAVTRNHCEFIIAPLAIESISRLVLVDRPLERE